MNKALYLGIVYSLPIIFYPLGLSHFQDIWIWYYIPFGFFYAIYIWLKPSCDITKYIISAPLVFIVILFLGVLIPIGLEGGAGAVLEVLPVMLIFSIPVGFIAGLMYVAVALLILKVFSKFGFGVQDS